MTGFVGWAVATDVEEVHALLCASDRFQANAAAPPPVRSMDTTRRRLEQGAVQVLRSSAGPAATFTLTWDPPFDDAGIDARPAGRPAYMSRLAVDPEALRKGSLAAVQCYRRAFQLAQDGGADVLRVEANPDLPVFELLKLLGFVLVTPIRSDGERRRVVLEKKLHGQDGVPGRAPVNSSAS